MESNVFYEKGKKYNCRKNGKPYFRKTATIGGKRRQFYGDGEKDVLAKIKEAEAQANKGLNLDYKNAKVGETMRDWLFNVKRVDRNIKDSSFCSYDVILRNHVEGHKISQLPLAKLTSSVLQAYITALSEEKNLSGATISHVLSLWKMFADWALEEGYITKNPCNKISIPGTRTKGKRTIEVFTEEERQAVMAYMEKTDYWYDTLIKLAFATGMRQGELIGLKWSDIYDGAIHVQRSAAAVQHVNKDGEREFRKELWDTKTANGVRTIPLLESTETMLKEHHLAQRKYLLAHGLPQTEFVFTSRSGEYLFAAGLVASYNRMLKAAGVKHHKFHAIRHTFATEAIRRGVDVKDLQKIMGHSDVATTYIYVQSDEKSQRAAIERMGAII